MYTKVPSGQVQNFSPGASWADVQNLLSQWVLSPTAMHSAAQLVLCVLVIQNVWPKTLANNSYFGFDYDNKMKYKHFHNHQKINHQHWWIIMMCEYLGFIVIMFSTHNTSVHTIDLTHFYHTNPKRSRIYIVTQMSSFDYPQKHIAHWFPLMGVFYDNHSTNTTIHGSYIQMQAGRCLKYDFENYQCWCRFFL